MANPASNIVSICSARRLRQAPPPAPLFQTAELLLSITIMASLGKKQRAKTLAALYARSHKDANARALVDLLGRMA